MIELVDDDRATLLGAFLELATRLQEEGEERQGEEQAVRRADLMARWRRRGLRAFDAGKEGRPGYGQEEGRRATGE